MIRIAAALTAFVAAMGVARADIPPPPPEHPLGEACTPFIGVWARTTMEVTPRFSSTTVLAIDSEHAVVLDYGNTQNVSIMSSAQSMSLVCTANADKTVTLELNGTGETPTEMIVTPMDETTFTTTEQSTDPSRGAPTPGFKPQTLTVTWKRLAR